MQPLPSLLTRRAMLRAALLAAGAAACPGMTGCGSPSGGDGGGTALATAPVARKEAEPRAAAEGARMVQELGADLFAALRDGTDNLVMSPYSVAVALAMTRAGAGGRPAAEMDRVLHASADPRLLPAAVNALTQHVDGLALRRRRHDGSTAVVQVDTASSLWGQRGLAWQAGFLEALARWYGAGMRQVDYRRDPEAARRAVNGWVADRTHDRIPHLLAHGVLTADTRLALVNAVYLKAPWQTPFLDGATQPEPFHRLDGSTVEVPMMRGEVAPTRSARGAGWTAVDLPYEGGGLAMLVVVPDAGRFDAVQRGFDANALRDTLAALRPVPLALRLPRFTARSQLGLTSTLAALGMPTAFTDAADFTGMTEQERLSVDAVVHEAYVAVDEQGTEAAAATAVLMRTTSGVADPAELVVDRPFLVVLHDTAHCTPLFIGRVTDPSGR